MYYLIAIIVCFHPHLGQKIGMLSDYFSNPEYEFWTTFSTWDSCPAMSAILWYSKKLCTTIPTKEDLLQDLLLQPL